MTAPGNETIIFIIALGILLSGAYAFGRIHQWHKRGVERDQAYRTGYDKASRSIMAMIIGQPSSSSAKAVATGVRHGGHSKPVHKAEMDRS
ncbi:hypothetical protein [Actinoplanes sp. M2I2]|uniref:hypothetical protein n=1 Tax=Actinoplanes sp. M2I2 TaxID=1734444 RepID=UPI0020215AA5|nr:hypothetical protein [Actinoplanes sp. M2I2]